ncbi:uncharacterized protein M421DRAFT_417688, partial [Didymella exigua CBS 183.55]
MRQSSALCCRLLSCDASQLQLRSCVAMSSSQGPHSTSIMMGQSHGGETRYHRSSSHTLPETHCASYLISSHAKTSIESLQHASLRRL